MDVGSPADDRASASRTDLEGNSRLLDSVLGGIPRRDIGCFEFAHVRLAVTGHPVPGGTLDVETSGTDGLRNVLVIGLDEASIFLPHFGYLFVDLGPFCWRLPWTPAPSSVPLAIPDDVPIPLDVHFQELAFGGPYGNTSNAVVVTIGE